MNGHNKSRYWISDRRMDQHRIICNPFALRAKAIVTQCFHFSTSIPRTSNGDLEAY